MELNLKLIGQKQMEKKLKNMANNSDKNLQEALPIAAFKVESDAKKNAPVDTGRLRASINSKILKGLAIVGVPVSVKYGKYIEFGTSRMSAQPFLYPAFQKNLRFITNLFKKAVQKETK